MTTPQEYFDRFQEPLKDHDVVLESPNPALQEELQGIVDQMQDRPFGNMEVLVLDDVGQRSDVFRDLATKLQDAHDVDTVVVKSPDLAVIVSDELTRAQIESLQPPMSNEPNSAVALQAMPHLLDEDPVPGITMVGITGIAIVLTAGVTFLRARRSAH
ncbi:DUF6676 family protein [Corynebacterium pseudopelargi]|uniref:Uncharacterized protein n=1 Tax=Corynebacterium pseudopelargi TaxID=2080757 RepID=A0A3G6IU94_9CORY|nr:DUF6676 family protein [Corynebacterium pseudopelargi]AZA09242.1 hypothetical protein CPPEL_05610 [Corynebacterium pseudopelargi]